MSARRMAIALALGGMVGASMAHAQGPGGGQGPQQMQQRFEQMQRMTEPMPGTRADRRRVMREHHQALREQMQTMRGWQGPGPTATPEERLQHMEERHAVMQRMIDEILRQQQLQIEDDD